MALLLWLCLVLGKISERNFFSVKGIFSWTVLLFNSSPLTWQIEIFCVPVPTLSADRLKLFLCQIQSCHLTDWNFPYTSSKSVTLQIKIFSVLVKILWPDRMKFSLCQFQFHQVTGSCHRVHKCHFLLQIPLKRRKDLSVAFQAWKSQNAYWLLIVFNFFSFISIFNVAKFRIFFCAEMTNSANKIPLRRHDCECIETMVFQHRISYQACPSLL